MKLLSVPGVFGMALGVVGVAYLADGVNGMGYQPDASHPVGQAVVGSMNMVASAGDAVMNMSVHADEMQPADFSDLLRIEDQGFAATFDGGVSTNVMSHHTIKKVEFGRVSEVSIVRTPTGTYSTDGLVAPHVQYPGVEVSEVPDYSLQAMTWDSLLGWVPLPRPNRPSVTTYSRTSTDGHVRTKGGQVCVTERSFRVCS